MSATTPPNAPQGLQNSIISFPDPGILLVLINRPKQLNSLTVEASYELDSVFQWFDNEPSLRVAIVGGVGKAFCVGADLKQWMSNNKKGIPMDLPTNGFGGISFRHGKKPIIAAVNGAAYGGGCEMAINCDMIVASASASFCLPEVKRGVTPFGGALPRLMRIAGRQRATEMALTGRPVTAHEFKEWGACNVVVERGQDVVDRAVELAKLVAANSPDAVIITREGLKMGYESLGVGDSSRLFLEGWSKRIYEGRNMQEGLDAFTEKRAPLWMDSKL
ncbi:hypothetical protein AJ80_07617 [Polytolypa hystricis UAMH7299]|uniref:Enoyl-CoA hydratase n=1 Tax=Polytolypa hystricis (strain UAMH7299) TaxID=1447883 RepID=A0A2B7XMY0_POLH7|nr:hypothetical protein AJ80_07617 [Polytolypa hystricis UAMH7299]